MNRRHLRIAISIAVAWAVLAAGVTVSIQAETGHPPLGAAVALGAFVATAVLAFAMFGYLVIWRSLVEWLHEEDPPHG